MTPRQLHALEWAVDIAAKLLERDKMRVTGFAVTYAEYQLTDARRALAAAWAEHRAAALVSRTKAPRRALQTVRGVSTDDTNAIMGAGLDRGYTKG